jgi:ATP-dependent DNA helicase RecQ
MSGLDVRFYCGGEAPWRDYAVFYRRRRAIDLSESDVLASVPPWGRTKTGLKPWPDVKASLQRDFISGTKKSFRVLVATKAFGMGIDKPSIRKIVHVVAPTSPEAFYQEVGRAGRDRQPSHAELLFCDIQPEVTNRILDPGQSHEDVMALYRKATEKDPYGGGDFLRTFYFHGQSFQGMEPAVAATYQVVRHLHNAIAAGEDLIVPFDLGDNLKLGEKDVEYGIVRLIHLGVVAGYIKDYNRNLFRINPTGEWLRLRKSPQQLAAYLAEHFALFVRRYHLIGGTRQVDAILAEGTSLQGLYDSASRQMMSFVYQQVERQRRAATRAMLEIARIGAVNGEQMRARLLNYLQASVRFTAALEGLDPAADPEAWIRILASDEHPLSPQDLAELHGAAQRVLASFPTHPGLLFLSAVSRPLQTDADPLRSAEEFDACVQHASGYGIDQSRVLWAFAWFRQAELLHKPLLAITVDRVMGRIHLNLASDISDLAPFLHVDEVRTTYLAALVKKAIDAAAFPPIRENP